MREIKLRYLHNDKWHYITLDGSENLRVAFEKWENIGKTTEFEQYTGLKDKNGKEIYEGDIVKDGLRAHVVEFKATSKSETLGHGCYGTNLNLGYVFNFYGNNTEDIEIIGNIHQNKDLLA